MKKITDLSGPEVYTPYAVGIATVVIFVHYNLMPKGYISGRMAAGVLFMSGYGFVLLVRRITFKKKKDGSDGPS